MKNIRNKDIEFIFEIYFKWKELNLLIKKHYTRGVNLKEHIKMVKKKVHIRFMCIMVIEKKEYRKMIREKDLTNIILTMEI